jgi:hypothetical protein
MLPPNSCHHSNSCNKPEVIPLACIIYQQNKLMAVADQLYDGFCISSWLTKAILECPFSTDCSRGCKDRFRCSHCRGGSRFIMVPLAAGAWAAGCLGGGESDGPASSHTASWDSEETRSAGLLIKACLKMLAEDP